MLGIFKNLFGTLKGNAILFTLALCVVILLLAVREYTVPESEMTKIEYGSKEYKPIQIIRNNSPYETINSQKSRSFEEKRSLRESSRNMTNSKSQSLKEKPTQSPILRMLQKGKKRVQESGKVQNLPLDLFTSEKQVTHLSQYYAPYGRLVACETIITIDSSKINTPVLALVTENVYHEGNLIIPAGAEIHGKASPEKTRERVDASGSWVVVWRDESELNGVEMELTGIALDRSINFNDSTWGVDDGTAGLKGTLIKSATWAEARLFASEFLSGLTNGSQDKRLAVSGLGEAQLVPKDTMENAVLQGTQSVIDRYAQKILEEIDDKGFYVRVPAGTQFYLYVTQTIDLTTGKKGNLINGTEKIWNNNEK